jgi:hypothetical protein
MTRKFAVREVIMDAELRKNYDETPAKMWLTRK